MRWEKLISNKRLGLEELHEYKKDDRTEFQRDYDRLIFSAPFRRLQNKTQVFPLPGSVFVHNRLTHSLEVSCVGRSLGNEVSKQLLEKHANLSSTHIAEIGAIIAAACLAHDLGNPPFGHSGEKAISTYFSEGEGLSLKSQLTHEEWEDLIHFEGNANAFRLLTHQFNGRRKGGFVMTYSTLASIVKYPYSSVYAGNKSKFGFFLSESDNFKKIATELELIQLNKPNDPLKYARHPLVYLVEAADDICYQLMDVEDAYKLRLISLEETQRLMKAYIAPDKLGRIEEICKLVDDKNEQIAYLRSCAIGSLVKECVNVFMKNEDNILSGSFKGSLIKNIADHPRKAYEQSAIFSNERIYRSKDVCDIELAGFQIITTLLGLMIKAVTNPQKAYSKLLIARVSEQYDINAPTLYGKVQAVLDYISGMTDIYALDLYHKINGNSLPAV